MNGPSRRSDRKVIAPVIYYAVRAILSFPITGYPSSRLYLWRIRSQITRKEDNGSILYGPESQITTIGDLYERYTTSLFSSYIAPDSIVLDVGANLGHFTVLAAKKAINGTVYSFEPDPFTFKLLNQNCKINMVKNVVTFNLACLDREGVFTLNLRLKNLGGHSFVKMHSWWPRETVKTVRLDDILKQTKLDVAKIDAEGSEVMILDGMRGIIRRSPNMKMFIECNPELLAKMGFTADDLIDRLEREGFTYSAILEEQMQRVPFSKDILQNRGFVNFFCERQHAA
ncbi:MAG: FkbM family methyltransferase [Conexivisphaerales archaeon]